eukprot:gene6400-1141_t
MSKCNAWRNALKEHKPFPANDMQKAVEELIDPETTDVARASLLTALGVKGETAEDIAAFSKDLPVISSAQRLSPSLPPAILALSQGGDGLNSYNVSTPASIVAAALGLGATVLTLARIHGTCLPCGITCPSTSLVAKHGNRAATSSSGSADLLAALGTALPPLPGSHDSWGQAPQCTHSPGLRLSLPHLPLSCLPVSPLPCSLHLDSPCTLPGASVDVPPAAVPQVAAAGPFAFLFAPSFHPSLRHVGPVRKTIGCKTIFNYLGPLLNPSRPKYMVLGVSDPLKAPAIAQALLAQPGLSAALVVCSEDGLDKISPVHPTHTWLVEPPQAPVYKLVTPQDFGVSHPVHDYYGGGLDCEGNARMVLALLRGTSQNQVYSDFVLMHSAALAVLAGKAPSLTEGMRLAREACSSGKATEVLNEYIRITTKTAPPADILSVIVRRRAMDAALAEAVTPAADMRGLPYVSAPTVSLKAALVPKKGANVAVLAEIKRASPSEHNIDLSVDVVAKARAYAAGGACAVSVLTEGVWFKGALADLAAVREAVSTESFGTGRPAVLRKDFVLNRYQIEESRAWGADSVLLIVACEDAMKAQGDSLADLITFSQSLGMEPLVEVVTEKEMETALHSGAQVIGINNRNLRTFKVDLSRTAELVAHARLVAPKQADEAVFVSLSGVSSPQDVGACLGGAPGVSAVLVGTSLMRSTDTVALLTDLTQADPTAHSPPPPTHPPKLVKICGVSSYNKVITCIREGIDLVGLMFYPQSKRYIGTDSAKIAGMVQLIDQTDYHPQAPEVRSIFPKLPLAVGVFVREDLATVVEQYESHKLGAVQLYGYPANTDLSPLTSKSIKVIWTVSIPDTSKLAEAVANVPAGACLLVIDTQHGGQVGGTGVAWQWSALKGVKVPLPFLIAGGVDPDNCEAAAAVPGSLGVDVSSGVETSGVKDHAKVRLLARRVKHSLPPYLGRFGGRFIPEVLMPSCLALEKEYLDIWLQQGFWEEVNGYLKNYCGRPTILYRADRLTDH